MEEFSKREVVAGDLVYVSWMDSAATHQWTHEDYLHDEPLMCESVGWYIRGGEETITIGAHRQGQLWDGLMSIPRATIKVLDVIQND